MSCEGPRVAPPLAAFAAMIDARAALPSKFLQSTHLQFSEHVMPAWKHSQYFFRHPLFLQLHPLLCRAGGAPATSSAGPAIFGRNALGFLSKMDSIAAWRTSSWLALLKQLLQLHPSQYNPEEKHSQYLRIARKENGESAMESIKMQHTKKKIILFVLF